MTNKIGEPFQPITRQMAKDWYLRNHLTTTGYLLAIKGILKPPGATLVINNVLEFCREWGITKSAFYRAVNALKASGEIDWEATEGLILKSPKSPKVVPLVSQPEPEPTNETGSDEDSIPQPEQCPTSGTVSHERNSQSHERNSQSHERDSHIYIERARAQIYSDLVDSLSDREREIFEEFVRAEWKKLKGEEIVSLERFLSRKEDFDNWHEKFLNSAVGRAAKEKAIAAKFDWRSDPRFDDWIWKSWNGGIPWTQEDEAEREQRYAFYCWAQDTDGYNGVCH